MATEDLAREAGELLSAAGESPSRSLNQLVALISRQVPACSGAAAALWRDGEPTARAASHPDLAELFEQQLATGSGPWLDALAQEQAITCPDTLSEERWPGFAALALAFGVRCNVTMVHKSGPTAITVTMYGARPRVLDAADLPLAEFLVAFGGAVLGSAPAQHGAQRAVLQLQAAVDSRAVVDQAKGILMHTLGCNADEALERMRGISQTRHLKVTEVAQRIIDSQEH